MYTATDSPPLRPVLARFLKSLRIIWTFAGSATCPRSGQMYCVPLSFQHPFFMARFFDSLLSMSLFYSGGMSLNDICDIAPDRVKKPLRPLPSGKISLRNGALFTGVLFLSAMVLLAFMPFQRAIFAGLLLLFVIAAYDLVHKAHPLSVILMSGCRLLSL